MPLKHPEKSQLREVAKEVFLGETLQDMMMVTLQAGMVLARKLNAER